jgi:hypothetical protein
MLLSWSRERFKAVEVGLCGICPKPLPELTIVQERDKGLMTAQHKSRHV